MLSHHSRAQSIFVQPRFFALVIKLIHGSEPIIMSVNLWRGMPIRESLLLALLQPCRRSKCALSAQLVVESVEYTAY